MRIKIEGVVCNTRGVEFPVKGFFWHDGAFFLFNPRPDRYPDEKGLMGGPKEKTLYWATPEVTPGEASKFIVKSMLVDMSKPKTKKK
jgi:hypothetical protein